MEDKGGLGCFIFEICLTKFMLLLLNSTFPKEFQFHHIKLSNLLTMDNRCM